MRSAPLTTQKGGISRLKTKGGARADTLYDLLNGYVTVQGTIVPREGTRRDAVLDLSTHGLTGFQDALHVFAKETVAVPTGYVLHILSHPTNPAADIVEIHFAAPYLRALYVVAEWSDGLVVHYWLAATGTWEPNRIYRTGDVVLPSTPNGYLYRATRDGSISPTITWTPNTPRTVGEKLEPTVQNDYYYEVVSVDGPAPRTGAIEPTWPEADGATVYEDADNDSSGNSLSNNPSSSAPAVPTDVTDRYG